MLKLFKIVIWERKYENKNKITKLRQGFKNRKTKSTKT